MLRFLLLGVLAVGVSGCAAGPSGPPHIEIDRTACAHCGMLVSEPMFAAARRVAGQPPRIFDDIGCLLEDRRAGGKAGHEEIWVHDATNGAWLEGSRAVFVRSGSVRTPMNGGVLAYSDLASAERAADSRQGRILRSLDALAADSAADSGKDGVQ